MFDAIPRTVHSGVVYINVTPHPITLQTSAGEVFEVPPSGILINAKPVEKLVGSRDGIQFVKTDFVPDPQSERLLTDLEEWASKNARSALVISSIIAAQAFPGRVVAMVPAPGFERVPPAEKRMRADKFTVF